MHNEGISSEENSNFVQLLKLRSEDNPQLVEWLEKKQQKYTSPEIQNEMLQVSFSLSMVFPTMDLYSYAVAVLIFLFYF